MPPKIIVWSIKRKKRKFHGNRFTKRKEQDEEDILLPNSSSNDVDTSIGVVRPNSPSSDEEMAEPDELLPTENLTTPKTRLPASVRKLTQEMSEDSNISTSESTDSLDNLSLITGFRLVYISMLTEVFQMLLCPKCKAGNITIEEESMKMGFASTITVACKKERDVLLTGPYDPTTLDHTTPDHTTLRPYDPTTQIFYHYS
eukprot:Seg3925.1 transcript_id=Seg3925.1/GoldUCD/mRNA.D3Y31 product="hypothetical protein" protein_id=Seg3925.1/GoldUCD/D3Y31